MYAFPGREERLLDEIDHFGVVRDPNGDDGPTWGSQAIYGDLLQFGVM